MIALIFRLLRFFGYTALVYLALLFAVANAGEGVQTLVRELTNIPAGIAPRTDTVRRLQELSEARDVDVLFVGSSHCYRAFDPRIFAAQGLRSFNLGSTSQSPVNSFYLLRNSLKRLRPRLIVFEAYWAMFGIDGAESFLDLSGALALSRKLVPMAWATGSLLAWNGLLLKAMDISPHAPVAAPDTVQDGDLYIPGGFVERIGAPLESIAPQDSYDVPIKSAQLHFFREILKMAKASGAKVMVVVQPMRAATVRHFLNGALISEQLSAIAHSEGAAFLDFNQLMDLEGPTYFYDADHLTQTGVEVFDRQLLRELGARGLLPQGTSRGLIDPSLDAKTGFPMRPVAGPTPDGSIN